MTPTLDLNCDMGEGFGAYTMGNDIAILDHVTSANIACGFHAGDPAGILATLRQAARRGVAVGAHVSYPDRVGFGRRAMQIDPDDLAADVIYQIGALQGMARAAGTRVGYMEQDPDLSGFATLGEFAAAGLGGCLGFLWWNAAPAKIFMGDTGSLALGGLVAGLSVTTRTELLMIIIGAIFVIETVSVVIQIIVFRSTGKRFFRMAPIHHHFENGGWAETAVVVRFWLLAAMAAMAGVAIFYGDWLTASGIGLSA